MDMASRLRIVNTWHTSAHSWYVTFIFAISLHLRNILSLILFGGQQCILSFFFGLLSSHIRGKYPTLVDELYPNTRNRYHLGYHNLHQISWGLAIGSSTGVGLYLVSWLLPTWYPNSIFGRAKRQFINHPIITWLQIRDGWAIWPDGGRADEWQRWRIEWEKNETDKKKLD